MEEGTVASWAVAEGDRVETGAPFCEIEIEKLTNEMEAPASGVVRKILCPEGETRACGEPIAIIAEADEDISGLVLSGGGDEAGGTTAASGAASGAEAGSAPEVSTPDPGKAAPVNAAPAAGSGAFPGKPSGNASGDVKITPKALKLAEEMGIDYRPIKGTGIHGMITREDIRKHAGSDAASTAAAASAAAAAAPADSAASPAGADSSAAASAPAAWDSGAAPGAWKQHYALGPGAKMSTVRKVTSRRMMESMSNTAQTSIFMDADLSELVDRYNEAKGAYKAEGAKLSYTAIILKAAAETLASHPVIRTAMTGPEEITTLSDINIGIAVDAEYGLTVPVMKQVDRLGLKDICRNLTVLADKAKSGTLSSEEMSGGVFTVSNVGMYGVKYFTPILNAPESAILGVGTLTQEVKVVDGGFQPRWILALSLTYDHRLVDGAPAARFLSDLRERIAGSEL